MKSFTELYRDYRVTIIGLAIIFGVMFTVTGIFIFMTPSMEKCYDLVAKKKIYGNWTDQEKDYMYEHCKILV